MFDIGFWEMTLIGVIALLVIGPERLPGLVRTVGLWVGRIRRYVAQVRDDIEKEVRAEELKELLDKPKALDDLYDVVEETKGTLDDAKKTFEAAGKSVQSSAGDWTRSIESAAETGDEVPGTEDSTEVAAGAGRQALTEAASSTDSAGTDHSGDDERRTRES